MSYAAMLSPFSMPYPKQGKVYNVKKGAFKNTDDNSTGAIIISSETLITGSVPKIKRGDLLCVTRNDNGNNIYVWPTRSRIVKKTRGSEVAIGAPQTYYYYELDVNLPVMGVAISSEDEKGNLKAILIKTTPPASIGYNNIKKNREPSSSNEDKGIFGIIKTPLGFSVNYEALTPGVVYEIEDEYWVLSHSNGYMECWSKTMHYKRIRLAGGFGAWSWIKEFLPQDGDENIIIPEW